MKRTGLTLIELLVAMAILAIIVLAVAQLFQQSTVAWESGYRRTRTAMVGRAILGYVAEDMGLAVWDGGTFSTPNSTIFWTLRGTNGVERITYSGTEDIEREVYNYLLDETFTAVPLYESSPPRLEVTGFDRNVDPDPEGPYFADVAVTVKTFDKGREEERTFQRRVYLVNRNRYYYD